MANIDLNRDGAVLRIAINRPEKKNALTADMYGALSTAFDEADVDPAVRVILLHGNGDAFTAGNDLVDFMEKPWKGQAVPPQVRFMRALAEAKKPIVVAVHGMAVGIGTTLLLHCDLIYAATDAQFIMPFVNLGIVPEAGSTLLLPALIGKHRAAELFMLGAPLTAQRAYEMGLVNAVFDRDALLPAASRVAQQLAAKPFAALLACKALMKRPYQAELERALSEEVAIVAERLESRETREALSAFLEKRKPDFSKL